MESSSIPLNETSLKLKVSAHDLHKTIESYKAQGWRVAAMNVDRVSGYTLEMYRDPVEPQKELF